MPKRSTHSAAEALLQQFVLALDDEIAAVEATDRVHVAPVAKVRDLGQGKGRRTRRMQFDTSASLSVTRHERVIVQASHGVTYSGRVEAAKARALTLEFYDRAPAFEPGLRVQRDSAWLTRSLRDGVRKALVPGSGFDLAMAVAPFGLGTSAVRPSTAVPYLHEIRERNGVVLSDDQVEAVQVAINERVSWLCGVPGAGKTAVLSTLCALLTERDDNDSASTLVVTPSNVSADVLVMALARELAGHPDWRLGLVRRIGPNPSRVLTDDVRSCVTPGGRARGYLPDECRIVVTPIANVYLCPGLWRRYTTVVVDEASMVSPPALALAAGLADERVVVAGDPLQLGPVVEGTTALVREHLAQDAFRIAGVHASMFEDRRGGVVLLREARRYGPELAAFIGALAYRGQLVTPPSAVAPATPRCAPLVFVDTSETGAYVAHDRRVNVAHAEVVRWIVRHLGRENAKRSGVLTLYLDQVAAIKRTLKRAHLRVGSVSTVHAAQAQTHEHATILDLADGPGAGLPFLGGSLNGDSLRLLAVGASRPREALWIVGHAEWLRAQGNVHVQRLLELVETHGVVVTAEELMSGDPALDEPADFPATRRVG